MRVSVIGLAASLGMTGCSPGLRLAVDPDRRLGLATVVERRIDCRTWVGAQGWIEVQRDGDLRHADIALRLRRLLPIGAIGLFAAASSGVGMVWRRHDGRGLDPQYVEAMARFEVGLEVPFDHLNLVAAAAGSLHLPDDHEDRRSHPNALLLMGVSF